MKIKKFQFIPFIVLNVDESTFEKIQSSHLVKSIHETRYYEALLDVSVPLIGADIAHSSGFDGNGQTVAILDTGVDSSHFFLSGGIVEEACFSGNDLFAISVCPNGQGSQIGLGSAVPCTLNLCDHGTHVAGIAAGRDIGASGVAKEANIIAVQIFSESLIPFCETPPCIGAFDEDIVSGLEYVYSLQNSYEIASVNMSIGGGAFTSFCDDQYPLEKAIIDNLRSVGIATIVSSGNGDENGNRYIDAISSPSCISTAISVGSTTVNSHGTGLPDDEISSFSNTSSFLDLLAPGQWIISSVPGGFDFFQGTSMAAPHVAGAWAIIKQYNPSASVTQIESAFKNTGVIVTDPLTGLTFSRIDIIPAISEFDTTAPIVTPPSNIVAEAEGPSDTVVFYPQATATDDVIVFSPPSCDPASGFTFPIGETIVTCEASDMAGNIDSETFTITVQDTNPPSITVPDTIVQTATDDSGAVVTYSGVSATDVVDGSITPICDPASGSLFPVGDTVVTCTATDSAGNSNFENFIVSIIPTCNIPSSGDWTITESCTVITHVGAPGNVIVQNNSVLEISSEGGLYIDFDEFNLTVNSGSGVLIKSDGKIDSIGNLPFLDITYVSVPHGTSVPECENTNECYLPYEVTVNTGNIVTWSNDDSAAHTVTSGSAADGPSGVFDSSLFMAGTTFSHTFESAGEVPYFCMVHPWMEGIVTVLES